MIWHHWTGYNRIQYKGLIKRNQTADWCQLDILWNICIPVGSTHTDLLNGFMHRDFNSGLVWSFRFLLPSWLKGIPYSSDRIICIICQGRDLFHYFLQPVTYATSSYKVWGFSGEQVVGETLWGGSGVYQSLLGNLKRMFHVFLIHRDGRNLKEHRWKSLASGPWQLTSFEQYGCTCVIHERRFYC